MNLIGKELGNRYEILEEIGVGGMATVYKAKDKILNRFVAVKILKEEFVDDTEFIKRFQVEAQAAASLSHQNIVSVYDVGNEEDIHYIVMELIEGQTLKEIIKQKGKLPWREAVNIASQIAAGLTKAHANHIVHRDIKPHNIIITKDGIAKVTDFGIAKAVSNSTINAMGSTVGSVHYFSPEHARGGYTDERSDIYSLGVVLYEMVTGKLPFDADTPVSVALKHIQEKPTEPIEINSKIPIGVNNIIMKAMAKDISERYQTARDMHDDLENIVKSPTEIKDAVVTIRKEGEFPTQKIPIVGASEMLKQKMNEEKEEKNMKKGLSKQQAVIRLVLTFVFAIALFVAAFMLGSYILGGLFGDSKNVSVPKLIGVEQEEAKRLLEEAELVMNITGTIESSDVPSGYVYSQSPKQGHELKSGSKVDVVISKGGKKVLVPKVTDTTPEVAKIRIEQVGLVYEEDFAFHKEVKSGDIIEQKPTVNSEVDVGSIVRVVISKGMESGLVNVPNVIGETEESATKKLVDSKLKVDVTTMNDPEKADGIVISQNPAAGEPLSELSKVLITVNKVTKDDNQTSGGTGNESTPTDPNAGKRLIPLNLSNKGQREKFTVKVTLEGTAIGSRVEYEGEHTRADGTIQVYVTDAPGALLKLYIDGKLDSEQVLK